MRGRRGPRGASQVIVGEELRHRSHGELGDRDQHRDRGLGVEQARPPRAGLRLPAEPHGVRPVEVVEVAELVDMRPRVASEDCGEDLTVIQVHDQHRPEA